MTHTGSSTKPDSKMATSSVSTPSTNAAQAAPPDTKQTNAPTPRPQTPNSSPTDSTQTTAAPKWSSLIRPPEDKSSPQAPSTTSPHSPSIPPSLKSPPTSSADSCSNKPSHTFTSTRCTRATVLPLPQTNPLPRHRRIRPATPPQRLRPHRRLRRSRLRPR